MAAGYTYLWEFIVETKRLEEFQRQYGSDGPWTHSAFRSAFSREYAELDARCEHLAVREGRRSS